MTYTIHFHDYWHAGSGLSGGTYADLVVNKNRQGFPLLPGKTVKGLLRHAAENLLAFGHPDVSQALIDELFGSDRHTERSGNPSSDDAPIAGFAYFTNAELSDATRSAIDDTTRPRLYEILATTALDPETGTAKDHTLRSVEVTIPLLLHGQIDIDNETDAHRAALTACMQYVKRLGQQRSRGLGRCTFQPTAA